MLALTCCSYPRETGTRTILFVKIGLVGLGFMGAAHLNAYLKMPDAHIAAIASNDPLKRSGDLTTVGGNIGGKALSYDFSAVRKYLDWRTLVDDPEIEIVDICLPSEFHAPVTIAALEAGKNVLCEKPMALSVVDCERMIAASTQYGHILMIGQVLRFWPEYRYLREFVNSGDYGRVRSATFVRRCGVPDWSRWLPDESRSGGALLDLLLHDVDQALDLFGTPERISAKRIGDSDSVMASLIYPGGPEVRIQGGWFASGTPLSMSFQVRAERAELDWSADGLMLSDMSGQRKQVNASGGDGYEAELAYFVECCRSGTLPSRCPPESSALAVKIALLMKQSRAAGGEQVSCAI